MPSKENMDETASYTKLYAYKLNQPYLFLQAFCILNLEQFNATDIEILLPQN